MAGIVDIVCLSVILAAGLFTECQSRVLPKHVHSKTLYFASKSMVLELQRDKQDNMVSCQIYHSSLEDLKNVTVPENALIPVDDFYMSDLERACEWYLFGKDQGLLTREKRDITYPGTKWCGIGNTAANETDYGEHEETDKCCQQHDFCTPDIGPFEYKFGVRNWAPYYKFGCTCEQQFYNCLKDVEGESAADIIGRLYFNFLDSSCLSKEYPLVCAEKGWWFTCAQWKEDTTQPKIWTFVPNQLEY